MRNPTSPNRRLGWLREICNLAGAELPSEARKGRSRRARSSSTQVVPRTQPLLRCHGRASPAAVGTPAELLDLEMLRFIGPVTSRRRGRPAVAAQLCESVKAAPKQTKQRLPLDTDRFADRGGRQWRSAPTTVRGSSKPPHWIGGLRVGSTQSLDWSLDSQPHVAAGTFAPAALPGRSSPSTRGFSRD
jgi:hypothetical protein